MILAQSAGKSNRLTEENVMENLKEQVYALVRSVPEGHVTTYGDIARALGNRGLARAVGNALHQNDDAFLRPAGAC